MPWAKKNMIILLLLYALSTVLAVDSPTAASTLQISCQPVANYTSAFIEANARLSIVYHEPESSFLIMYTNRSDSGVLPKTLSMRSILIFLSQCDYLWSRIFDIYCIWWKWNYSMVKHRSQRQWFPKCTNSHLGRFIQCMESSWLSFVTDIPHSQNCHLQWWMTVETTICFFITQTNLFWIIIGFHMIQSPWIHKTLIIVGFGYVVESSIVSNVLLIVKHILLLCETIWIRHNPNTICCWIGF